MKTNLPESFQPFLKKVYYKVRAAFYSGSAHFCHCCNQEFRAFLPGPDGRPDAQCPKCGSLERHRLLVKYLQDKTDFLSERHDVLDIAPTLVLQKIFKSAHNINYLSADLESELAMEHFDLLKIPRSDESYDVIFCYHVLEHIEEEQQALKEIHRVLKSDGWAVIQSPVDYSLEKSYENDAVKTPEERLKHFGQQDHVRIYGKDYPERLKAAGFDVITENFVETFDESEIRRYGFDSSEKLYICRKK